MHVQRYRNISHLYDNYMEFCGCAQWMGDTWNLWHFARREVRKDPELLCVTLKELQHSEIMSFCMRVYFVLIFRK